MLEFLQGKKTYLAALGLLGLGVYQLTTGDVAGGVQSLLAAASAAGLRSAVAQQEVRVMQGLRSAVPQPAPQSTRPAPAPTPPPYRSSES